MGFGFKVKMGWTKDQAIAFLVGYVTGLESVVGRDPDPGVTDALKALGAKPEHLVLRYKKQELSK